MANKVLPEPAARRAGSSPWDEMGMRPIEDRAARVLTREQCRRVDQWAVERYGIPSIVLMENAGRGVVEGMIRLGLPGPWLICCGRGNNAGDGFVIARHAEIRGVAAITLLYCEPDRLTGDAAVNYRILAASGATIIVCGHQFDPAVFNRYATDAGAIVDALLGTGAVGAPRPPLDMLITHMNACAAPIVAVDLPSGLDCDTGVAAAPTVRAHCTFTFVAQKPGFLVPGAERFTGSVHVCDIGVPPRLIAEAASGGICGA